MIKRLKKRFVIFTMAAVTCLLVFIVVAINGLNWIMLERQSDEMLKTLVDSNGSFHKMDLNRRPPFMPPLNMDKMRASRFFIVHADLSGNIYEVNIERISAIDKETAEGYAVKVLESGKEYGKAGSCKFAVKKLKDEQLIFFLDISEQTEDFFTVLFVSALIALFCWIILLIIVIPLSAKVVRPVIIGIEKQKQFITNAGHEMKTPLAVIQSNNDTMALIHGENKYNKNIRTQTKRLSVLTANLLTLAELEEEIVPPTDTVNISEIINELIPLYKESAAERNISFSALIKPDIIIQTNSDLFRRLMTLLLDNAVKYTPCGGEILLSLSKEGKYVLITEENTCEPCVQDPERLFERFYRGDSARTQNSEPSGYGIGLSAARAICENFGGSLTAFYPSASNIRFTAKF